VLRSATRPLALVGLVAVLVHVTALFAGFIWLDHAHIQDGLALAAPGAWDALFTRGFAGTGFYRPLMAVSLSLDAAVGGAPWLFHATSLLWHAAAAVLTVVAAETLGLSRKAALLAGTLFAVHPATSLVAAAIAFRSEAMITVALLALVVAHRRALVWPAALALLGGALSKETALVLAPLVIGALELDARLRPSAVPTSLRTRWRLFSGEAAALALAVALRLAFAPSWRATAVPLAAGEAIGTRLAALAKGALLLAAPVDRTICDAFAVTGPGSAAALAGAMVLLGTALLAWKRRGPALLLMLALLPSLNLVPIMRWWSPHYLYLPLAFAAMLAAEAVMAPGRPVTVRWAAVAVAVGFGALVLRDDLRFGSDEALWRAEVARNDTCREGHFYLGQVALAGKRLADAAAHFERALQEQPGVLSYVDRGAALQNLGVTRLEQRQLEEARAAFRAALALVTEEGPRRRLRHNLATTELSARNAAEAARLLEPEAQRPDALPESLFVRARALHQLGREDEAGRLVRRLQAGGYRASGVPPPPEGRRTGP
jgi:protein O-mannosyl-transferase